MNVCTLNRRRRRITAGLLALVLLVVTAGLAQARAGEADGLAADVRRLFAAFRQGNLVYLAERMHPQVVDALGGRAAVLQASRQAMASPQMRGLEILEVQIGEPVEVASTPARRYVAVPFVAHIQLQRTRIRSVGFQLAIQDAGETAWWFLEGAKLNSKVLSRFFPDFPETAVLPPVSQEILER